MCDADRWAWFGLASSPAVKPGGVQGFDLWIPVQNHLVFLQIYGSGIAGGIGLADRRDWPQPAESISEFVLTPLISCFRRIILSGRSQGLDDRRKNSIGSSFDGSPSSSRCLRNSAM